MPRRTVNQNDFFPLVNAEFSEYERVRKTSKATAVDPIDLELRKDKSSHIGRTAVLHSVATRDCFLEGEISERDLLKYTLKIFVPSFGSPPCLRIDSRGNDHLNHETGDGLPSRPVPAPHFHKVDSDGWLRAYLTDELRDPKIAEAVAKDIALGTNLFCQEVNLVSPSGSAVVLQKVTAALPLSNTGAMDAVQFP